MLKWRNKVYWSQQGLSVSLPDVADLLDSEQVWLVVIVMYQLMTRCNKAKQTESYKIVKPDWKTDTWTPGRFLLIQIFIFQAPFLPV